MKDFVLCACYIEKEKCLVRKLMDLPNNSIVNPLAPLPTQQKKGVGHSAGQNAKPKSNVAPPPYVPPIVNGPSPADMPPNPIPQSSTAVATPVFHQHPTDSHHFGFSVLAQQPGHIMPPRMEPDLQVLNNPYIATIQGDQVPSNTSHLPTPQPNYQSWFIPHQPPATIPDSCIDPSLDSLLSSRQTLATADIHHKSLEKLSSEGSSEEELESLSSNPLDTEAGEVSGNESNKDEDNAFGWGAKNLRQSTHPGTCQSLQSKDKAQPEGSQHGAVIDILECHHHTNSCPSVPDHDLLTLVHDSVNEVSQRTRAPCNSKKAKDEGPLPSQLRFYKAVWKDCLKDAKQECRAAHPLSNLFPSKSHDFNLSIMEVLITVIIEWNQCSYWPDHKQDMACLIIPLSCLALIAAAYHCVLDGFVKNGTGKTMPQFSGKAYISIFHGMMKVLNDILHNPYHGVRLCDQLSQWVKEGWAALKEVDSNVERYQHIQAVLD
ncbi:hypothetical protein F5J12DRAFT_787453 [Pisolithus orientalis]|uniref:uncharacterized protein n=1 Tax=Pisolithus orientalis TaxID=936130 RepID=UPI002223F6BD|nr:uncharacterized protein F5J12DRAFT_787453 [Pisolithus orientalis]KAI5984982.1 hypothetical protein F5J12DRAFT_787453 [Pisolithus orientalis]